MYIRVDHSEFAKTAGAIEAYLMLMKTKMSQATQDVDTLCGNWQGSDSLTFKHQWDKSVGDDSTYKNMYKSLEAYAEFLRSAGSKYRDAQARAINRANSIPKW